jgi:hypothetical protein
VQGGKLAISTTGNAVKVNAVKVNAANVVKADVEASHNDGEAFTSMG